MSKPTREEMLFWIDRFRLFFSPYVNEQRVTGLSDQEADKAHEAIRRLIESLNKKPEMSKEVWNKWTARIKDDYNLGPMHIIYLIKALLAELGLEVEEKEVSGE